MSTIQTTTGLLSGLDFETIVNALVSSQQQAIDKLTTRAETFQARNTGLEIISTSLLTLKSFTQQFGEEDNFSKFGVANSGSNQFAVTTSSDAVVGSYQFQALREVSTHQLRSSGLPGADKTVGAGTLVIASGGELHTQTDLELLNGGTGVSRGSIRITDRSGASATIDLSAALTVDDVLDAINASEDISVTADVRGGALRLTDTTGLTDSDLRVENVGTGLTATHLGILGTASADTLTGSEVYYLTGDFQLSQLNDGNQIKTLSGAPDIKITLSDDSTLEIDLSSADSLGEVVKLINEHEDNTGQLTAQVQGNHLVLTDNSGGGGSSVLSVEDINGSSVVAELGLDVAATGDQLTGRSLLAGMNSVLLHNLRGGQGIGTLGEISLTDRTGNSAVIDLSDAQSLDDVIEAINSAQSGGGIDLQLEATIDSTGTGLVIRDTSGATAANLTIADVGSGTLAADLGIAVDDAVNEVNSESLGLRYVNKATLLADYAPDGSSVNTGSITITDSAGNQAVINITSSVKTVGDVLQRINAAMNISVTAELNETGDGFVLIDEAGGSGTLTVEEVGGTTAADLRLTGTAELDGDGKYRISSRRAAIVEVEETDTLTDVVEKINRFNGTVTATLVDDGSSINPLHLVLNSTQAGREGKLIVDGSSLGLSFQTLSEAEDAVLQVGGNSTTGFLKTSNSNHFESAVQGIDIDILAAGKSPATVTVSSNIDPVKIAVSGFVQNYNTLIDTVGQLTKFDMDANERGILQGEGIVLRVLSRIDTALSQRFSTGSDTITSLADIGIRVTTGGKLEFDETRFDQAFQSDPTAFQEFFLDDDNGVAAKLDSVIDSLTDPLTGTFAVETEATQAIVDDIAAQIERRQTLLESQQVRLLNQFYAMESALSVLQSQQTALSGVVMLEVDKAGTGVA